MITLTCHASFACCYRLFFTDLSDRNLHPPVQPSKPSLARLRPRLLECVLQRQEPRRSATEPGRKARARGLGDVWEEVEYHQLVSPNTIWKKPIILPNMGAEPIFKGISGKQYQGNTTKMILDGSWWFILLTKWVITSVISELTLLIPPITIGI